MAKSAYDVTLQYIPITFLEKTPMGWKVKYVKADRCNVRWHCRVVK